MKCPVCEKGVLRRKKVAVEKFGVHIGDFPAEVCSACGEQIFSEQQSIKIEAAIKRKGLWGLPQESRVYRVGGNFVVSLKKTVADALGVTRNSRVLLTPQTKKRRLIVDFLR